MEDLFKTLPELLSAFEDAPDAREALVFAAWIRIAGPAIAEQTAAVSLDEKRLVVLVRDAAWKRHLESLAGQMVFKLNSALRTTAVRFIEFRFDAAAKWTERSGAVDGGYSESELESLAAAQINESLKRSAEQIRDGKLRNQFLLAAGSCLLRRKRDAEGTAV